MIKKLRNRFVLTAIASVFAVLAVLIGGINIFNYLQVVSDADEVLKILSDNGGSFPNRMMPGEDNIDRGDDPSRGRRGGRGRIDSPEIAYETRYFSVTVGKDNSIVKADVGRISAVSEETAGEYALEVVSSGRTSGFIGEYRYTVSSSNDGKLVIFCDCGAGLANFRSFLKISIIISAAGLILVSIIAFLISGKVIKPVAESYEKQKRFITDAGHEIKTPLAIINADADVLAMDIGEDNEWLADIKKQTTRLAGLTGDLILLSKMEEGEKLMMNEEIDLSALTEDQTESFKAVAVAKKIRTVFDIDRNIKIKGDAKSAEQMLSILLDNAVKYCPEGGTVEAKLFKKNKNAVMEITNDTNTEIPDEDLRHLFDRFFRTDKSRSSATGGHGIGLSVASAIVTAHSGKITVAKKAAQKITFTVLLPVFA